MNLMIRTDVSFQVMLDFLIAGKCKMSEKVVAKALHVPLQEPFHHQPGR